MPDEPTPFRLNDRNLRRLINETARDANRVFFYAALETADAAAKNRCGLSTRLFAQRSGIGVGAYKFAWQLAMHANAPERRWPNFGCGSA